MCIRDRCSTCDRVVFYPRAICPGCLGDTLEWRPSRGTGRVYAVTVEQRQLNPRFPLRAPYAIALVDLDDGGRMLSNIVECDPAAVTVGMAVAVTWEPLSDGRRLPQFVPVRSDA